MVEKNKYNDIIIYVLLIALFIAAAFIIKPFLVAMIYDLLLPYIFYPVYIFIQSKIKSPFFSALIVCLGVLAIIIGVAILFFGAVFRQAIDFYLFLQKLDFVAIIREILPSIISSSELSESIVSSINTSLSSLVANALRSITDLISDIPIIIIQLLVVIFTFFFGLKDGKETADYIRSLSPLKKENNDKFFKHLIDITNSVLLGQIIVGIIQGLVAGVGYFLLGIPNALLLTFLTILFSTIPFVGAWLIWLPVDIYLFAPGESHLGILLMIYGIFVISWVDNIVRMLFVARRTKMNTAVIMIGMLGGLFAFGFLGLIIGPLILGYVLLVIEPYRKGSTSEELIFKKVEP